MERYGICKTCRGTGEINGHECLCGGTGFSGDAMDLLYPEEALRIKGGQGKSQPVRSRDELIELAVSAMVSSNKKFGRK